MAKKQSSSDKTQGAALDELAGMLAERRREKGWTQLNLARRAGVSPLTVQAAESAVSLRKKPIRWGGLTRIAVALGLDPHALHALAGIEPVSKEKVRALFARPGLVTLSGQSIESFLDDVKSRLRDHGRGLLITMATSKPVAMSNPVVLEKVTAAIGAGLHLALVNPSLPLESIAGHYASHPALIEFYTKLSRWCVEAKQKYDELLPDHKEKISVFHPRMPERCGDTRSGLWMMTPPLQIVQAYRPMFLLLPSAEGRAEYSSLGVFTKATAESEDTWMPIHRSDDIASDRLEVFTLWREFFGGILRSWRPDQEVPWDEGAAYDWSRVHLGKSVM